MGSYLIACHDAGGTIPPVLALAQAFSARGDRVTVLSQPCVRSRAESAGASFREFSALGDYRAREAIESQLDIAVEAIAGRSVGEDVLVAADDLRPDAIVIDANLAGALAAAEISGRPSAVLLHSTWSTFVDVWFADLWPLLGDLINGTRSHFGLGAAASWSDAFAAHPLLLSVVPPEFDGETGERQPDTLRHLGFLVPATSEAAEFPAGDGAAVLVGLSTTYQGHEGTLRSIVEALGALPVRALVTTAGQVDVDDPPSNVTVVDYAPHAALMPTADLMVSHAGLGSIAAALAHGVPLVCAPIGRDQPRNAERVAALGAGIDVGLDPSSASISAAVEDVLGDERFRVAAREVAASSAAAGGANAALQAIDGIAGVSAPPDRGSLRADG